MRACDVVRTLDRVALFRAQAKQSNRHLEDLGNDLSSALALLDARQARDRQTVGASSVTQGADRAVLEWSQGVIVKLSGGLSARPSSSSASGGDQRDIKETSERHARNARRWLSDSRTWEAFVRSIAGSAVADPNVSLSLSASLAVLRAAIFTVRIRSDNAAEGREKRETAEQKTNGVPAQEWAAMSIHVLCNGVGVDEEGRVIRASPRGIGERMRKMEFPNNSEALVRVGLNGEKHHESRALMRVTLDAFVTLMEEVLQGHVANTSKCHLPEVALTDLLRFQLVLQGNQPNRRKVFSACCGRLMNALFQILPSSGHLRSAIEALLWNAFFHEEHLEGFREAFVAVEASGGAAPDTSTLASAGKGSKRRKKNKSAGAAGGEEVDGGGTASTPLRVCYQQQLLEELSGLVSARSMEARLAATKGAPLLLEGFVLRLRQAGDVRTDIHQAAAGGTMARNTSSATGGKRLRAGATSSRPGVSSSSPASQMFKMWASLTAALAPLSRCSTSATGRDTCSSTTWPVEGTLSSPSLAFLLANNAMLKLLAGHNVYRINEDWGGHEFKQLKRFAKELLTLAGSDEDSPEGTGTASAKQAMGGFNTVEEAVELAKAFQMLLDLNHNILHENLRPLLRMAIEWAASAPGSKRMLALERKHGGPENDTAKDISGAENQAASRDGDGTSTGDRVEGAGGRGLGAQEELLRRTAIELVVNLVETYGRLRQIDHLVQALFGAVADAPSASASVLRGDECVTALARAFRRLPEGQIDSMWHVFAGHLRASWTPHCSGEIAPQDRSNLGTVANARHRAEDEIVAKELDAELFVLFLRNLHVNSSVASGVGKLCSKLAQESLRVFSRELERVAGSPCSTTEGGDPSASSCSPASSKKRKKTKQFPLSADRKVTDADHSASSAAGTVLAFRPALDVHGWLLELDTRCRFWAAVLNASPESGTSMTETVPMNVDPHHDEDLEGRDGGVPSESSSGSHPQGHGALRSIVEFADKLFGEVQPQVDDSMWGASRPEMRLRRTLQQVAVHRVQQIYAQLNGAVALEGVTPDPGEEKGERGRGAVKEEEHRLETEARALTDFACRACVPHGRRRGRGKAWGDEDDHVRITPSWSMMMPYLPVWVGFASKEQVVLFLEALFTRCAKDIVAGRTQDESSPLRLLTDTSFYETEAVAQCAPKVILSLVYRAIRVAVDDKPDAGIPDRTGSDGTLDDLLGDIQSLASSSGGKTSCFEDDAWGTLQGYAGKTERALENDGTREGLGTQENGKEVPETTAGSLMPILEACGLLLLTERFPQGFFEEDATGRFMVAIEALDTVCFRTMQVHGRSAQCPDEERDGRRLEAEKAALLELLASLRSLLLRLGLSLPPISPLLERLPAADTIARVISPGVSGSLRLLRSSVTLTPFLAARCVASGQVDAILAAASRIDIPPLYGENAGRHKSRQRISTRNDPRTEFAVQMAFFHAMLSGVVAGETRRLTAIASSDSSSTSETEDAIRSDEDDSLDHGLTQRLWLSTPEEPSLMLGLVARLVALLPPSRPSSAPGRPSEEKQGEGLNTMANPVSDPLLLCVWGDALRLSFLNPNAEELVFEGPETKFLKRNRSEWVEDIIYFLEASFARSRVEVGGSSSCRQSLILAEDGQGGTPSQRSAVCGLVRAVCGCCHLLDPHLQPQALEALVKVFLSAATEGESGGTDAANGGERLKDTRVLESAFCLLVQHASDAYLRAIFRVLLETLEAWGPRVGDMATGPHDPSVVSRVKGARPAGSRRCLGEDGPGGQESSAVAAITFIRLTALSGHGGDFTALMRDYARALVTVLCNELRLPEDKFRDGRGRCNVWRDGLLLKLENGTRVLDALDAILNRHPFSSVSIRVVSVVLGSIETVGRVSVLAVESTEICSRTRAMSVQGTETFERGGGMGMGPVISSNSGGVLPLVEVLLASFRACCRLLCTLLQHYPRKVCACTPPFATLCRSLLRLFFCLASPEMDGKTKKFPRARGRYAAGRGEGQDSGPGSQFLKLSVEQQIDAASSLARVLEQFTPHKDNFKKYSVFFLLEYVSLAGSMALEPAPKSALHAGIFAVMDTCTPKEMRQLHGLLGALPTGQEVFRSLHEEYIRQYKYTGKI